MTQASILINISKGGAFILADAIPEDCKQIKLRLPMLNMEIARNFDVVDVDGSGIGIKFTKKLTDAELLHLVDQEHKKQNKNLRSISYISQVALDRVHQDIRQLGQEIIETRNRVSKMFALFLGMIAGISGGIFWRSEATIIGTLPLVLLIDAGLIFALFYMSLNSVKESNRKISMRSRLDFYLKYNMTPPAYEGKDLLENQFIACEDKTKSKLCPFGNQPGSCFSFSKQHSGNVYEDCAPEPFLRYTKRWPISCVYFSFLVFVIFIFVIISSMFINVTDWSIAKFVVLFFVTLSVCIISIRMLRSLYQVVRGDRSFWGYHKTWQYVFLHCQVLES